MTHQAAWALHPLTVSVGQPGSAAERYLDDPLAKKLVEFFEAKGLPAIKAEDQRQDWYPDWLAYQSEHHLYATLLSPSEYSTLGSEFNLPRYARFMELFAYFSPAHAYSMQCTFLGLFPILLGGNVELKQEAVTALEAGGLFALGISEKEHGSDLFGNEFCVSTIGDQDWVANGRKYYIGNSNCASMISILARKKTDSRANGRERRAPFVVFALRPKTSPAYRNIRKIDTLGVRAGYVGEFEVTDHALPLRDLVAEGRGAWDAVFGTVTLGKFFLGFGAIGICEHAFTETAQHLQTRILYGQPVVTMPHIESISSQAYARLTAMKLYAYRALDYVHAASAADRRYLLFTAVQKARVSTEGVKVMALLSECIGAKGFESDTYFEMAIRDAQLIPGLEGSMHINLGLTGQFIVRYFERPDLKLMSPQSLSAGEAQSLENPYLFQSRAGAISTIGFPQFLLAYDPLRAILNVRLFVRQAQAFYRFIHGRGADSTFAAIMDDTETGLAVGQCMATIVYAQLIAENSTLCGVTPEMISAIFHSLIADLSISALTLASVRRLDTPRRVLARRMIAVPRTTAEEWQVVSQRAAQMAITPSAYPARSTPLH